MSIKNKCHYDIFASFHPARVIPSRKGNYKVRQGNSPRESCYVQARFNRPNLRHSEPLRKLRSPTWQFPEGILLRSSTFKTKRTKMPSRTFFRGQRKDISATSSQVPRAALR